MWMRRAAHAAGALEKFTRRKCQQTSDATGIVGSEFERRSSRITAAPDDHRQPPLADPVERDIEILPGIVEAHRLADPGNGVVAADQRSARMLIDRERAIAVGNETRRDLRIFVLARTALVEQQDQRLEFYSRIVPRSDPDPVAVHQVGLLVIQRRSRRLRGN